MSEQDLVPQRHRLVVRHPRRTEGPSCRPKEARTLTWSQVHGDRWILVDHKTAEKTRRPRVIYLTGAMQKLMSVLRLRSTSDHVFLNGRGEPWTNNAVRLRIKRVKEKSPLAKDVCAYLLRHSFGTNAILNGVDALTVAELMGHSSLDMIRSVYVHLADQHSHLHSAVEKAAKSPVDAKQQTCSSHSSVEKHRNDASTRSRRVRQEHGSAPGMN